MTAVTCRCGRSYTLPEFRALRFVQTMSILGSVAEIRQCAQCKTALGIELVEAPEDVRQRLGVEDDADSEAA